MQRLMLLLLLCERLLFFEIWATGAGELGQPLFLSRAVQRRGQPRTAAAHGHAGPREGPMISHPLSAQPGAARPLGHHQTPQTLRAPRPGQCLPQAGYQSSRPWLPIIPGGHLRLANCCPAQVSAPSTLKSLTISRHTAKSPQSSPVLSSSPTAAPREPSGKQGGDTRFAAGPKYFGGVHANCRCHPCRWPRALCLQQTESAGAPHGPSTCHRRRQGNRETENT